MVVVIDINAALFGRFNPPTTFDHTFVPRLIRSVDIVHAIAKVGSEPALTMQLGIQFMLAIWTRPTQDNLSLFLLHSAIPPAPSVNYVIDHAADSGTLSPGVAPDP